MKQLLVSHKPGEALQDNAANAKLRVTHRIIFRHMIWRLVLYKRISCGDTDFVMDLQRHLEDKVLDR